MFHHLPLSWVPVLLGLGITLSAPAAEKSTPTTVIPLRGMVCSASDLVGCRDALTREPWRRTMLDQITSAADVWVARSDEWVRGILPPPGSTFAYGISGCPACGAAWKNFGADTCSFDRPGKVTCRSCRRVFPDPDPKSPYHDSGKGIRVDGKRYYLAGVWNSFVVQSMYGAFTEDQTALSNLGAAYALTGRDEYARKAIVIMDALATLSPTTRGPRDFVYEHNLDSDQGRLHLLTSIVYRAQVPLARTIDLVGRHPLMRADSPTSPGVSVMENIRRGLFDDYLFRHFDVRHARLSTLHNHEADSVRAMAVAGLLFGNADYIRWSMQCLDALIANTVDRDGMYYETSVTYGEFTSSIFCDMAELLTNYDPASYAGTPGDFPPRRNWFDNPKLRRLVVDNNDLTIAGHGMSFGNSHGDHDVITSAPGSMNPGKATLLAKFAILASDPATRSRARQALAAGMRQSGGVAGGNRWWLLRVPDPLPDRRGNLDAFTGVGDARFFSTKGMAAFQFGQWPNRRGFVIRGGPNLPHAHDDLLGLNLYDVGRELSAEIGYGVFDTHVHKGWGTRAASHCLVTVDGDAGLEGGEYFKKTPGARWRSFWEGGNVRYVDADGRSQFPARLPVKEYRRRFAAVDVDPGRSYYVDVFDVEGGSVRDYLLHAPYNDRLGSESLVLAGVSSRPVPGAWTLAGLDAEWRNAPWNRPGHSWGERVTAGEVIRRVTPDDGVGGYGWVAPGRGYGFLYNLRGAETAEPWSAEWTLEGSDQARLRATFLPVRPGMALSACAPDIYGRHIRNAAVWRDSGTSRSRFVVILEPYRSRRTVADASLVSGGSGGPLVVRVILADGATDHVVFGGNEGTESVFSTGHGSDGVTDAEFAWVRTAAEGDVRQAALFRGSTLGPRGGPPWIHGRPTARGVVESVDIATGRVAVKLDQPADVTGAAAVAFASRPDGGTVLIATRPGDIRTSGPSLAVLNAGDVVLQKIRVSETDPRSGQTTTSIPMPLAAVHEKPTRALDNKSIADANGSVVGKVRACPDLRTLVPDPATSLKRDRDYAILDIAPGDRAEFAFGGAR